MRRQTKWLAVWVFTLAYAIGIVAVCLVLSFDSSNTLDRWMQTEIVPFQFFKWTIKLTGWKLFGGVGTFLFAGRWIVQAYHARQAGKPVTPLTFWVFSLIGSNLTLIYFIYSPKQDMVGVLGNFVPSFVAAYNLYLEVRNRSRAALDEAAAGSSEKKEEKEEKKDEKKDDPPDTLPHLGKNPLPIIHITAQESAAGE